MTSPAPDNGLFIEIAAPSLLDPALISEEPAASKADIGGILFSSSEKKNPWARRKGSLWTRRHTLEFMSRGSS